MHVTPVLLVDILLNPILILISIPTYFGAKLSSDLCGPFPKSIDGHIYILNVVDACTNILCVYFLLSKSSPEVKAALSCMSLNLISLTIPLSP